MHGGAAGSGAPVGNKNAVRHGHYIAEAIAERRALAALIRSSRATLADWAIRSHGFSEADIGVVRDNARQLRFKPESTGFE
jgi:hypothetical protein